MLMLRFGIVKLVVGDNGETTANPIQVSKT